MMFGAHVIVSATTRRPDRAFLRDVLGLSSVDAGHGWLIFALPPAEVAVHPAEETGGHELYFMCDDLKAEIPGLGKKGIQCSEVQEARWGSIAHVRLPGGGEVGFTSRSILWRSRGHQLTNHPIRDSMPRVDAYEWPGDQAQLLRKRHHFLVIEIRARHVHQPGRLLLHRFHHSRGAVSRGHHRDAGVEIQEAVSIHVSTMAPSPRAATNGYERV